MVALLSLKLDLILYELQLQFNFHEWKQDILLKWKLMENYIHGMSFGI